MDEVAAEAAAGRRRAWGARPGPRRGAEYLAGLRDGRKVWLEGRWADDVLAEPAFAGVADSVAALYDQQHDPALAPLLTAELEGRTVPRAYVPPRTPEELRLRREQITSVARSCGGLIGRAPEYMASILVGMLDVRDELAAVDPAFAARLDDYVCHVRDRDLCLTHAFTDPPVDRSAPVAESGLFHVVERRPDGVVVRGLRAVATLAPVADECLNLCPPRPMLRPEQVVFFSIPLDTPGLSFVCREPFGDVRDADHPLSGRFDEVDAWAVYEDVFVPSERVFLLGTPDLIQRIWGRLLAHAYWHILVRSVVKAQVLAGLAYLLAEYSGAWKTPQGQQQVAQVVRYAETLRACALAAEVQARPNSRGTLVPDPSLVTTGRIVATEQLAPMNNIIRELSGHGLLMAPGRAAFADPWLAEHVRRFFAGNEPGIGAEERVALYRFAWEFTTSAFAGRQLLFELFNAGGLDRLNATLAATCDKDSLTSLVRGLIGSTS